MANNIDEIMETLNESRTVDFPNGSRFRHIWLSPEVDFNERSNKIGTVLYQRTQGYVPGEPIFYSIKFEDGVEETSLPQEYMKPSYSVYKKGLTAKKGGKSKRRVNRKKRSTRRRRRI